MATDVLLPESNNKFDAAAAKEWYYGVFKKSAEWKSYYAKSNNRTSQANGKKLPNWKHGVYRKVGNMEIVEFPLDQSRTSIPIEKNTLSTSDIKKIAAASLTRIAFIKRGNEISVREIDYIPEWTYLQKKKFDISDVMFGRTSGDFSGRVLIKKWNGDVLSRRVLENGRTVKKGRVVNSAGVNTARSTEPCPTVEVCLWQQDCNEVWAGDQYLFTTCGDWYVLYCWNEEICEEEEDECAGMSEEECVCYMFGICDDGDPECRGCDNVCTMSENEARGIATGLSSNVAIASETTDFDFTNFTDFKKYKNPKWTCLKSLTWKLISKEIGIIKLVDPVKDVWNWESLTHSGISLTGMPIGGTVSPNQGTGTPSFVAGASNVLYAAMSLNFDVTYSPAGVANCPGLNAILAPYTYNYTSKSPFWDAKPE